MCAVDEQQSTSQASPIYPLNFMKCFGSDYINIFILLRIYVKVKFSLYVWSLMAANCRSSKYK